MDRRRFLANSAKLAMALPFLRAARADGQVDQVRRLVVLFKPDGIHHPSWLPGAGFTFEPGSCLEPLSADSEDLLVIQGCHLTTSGTHEHGTRAVAHRRRRDHRRGLGDEPRPLHRPRAPRGNALSTDELRRRVELPRRCTAQHHFLRGRRLSAGRGQPQRDVHRAVRRTVRGAHGRLARDALGPHARRPR